ncbi:hypothetical protein EXIGLDRAFT_804961, partial [Exidia glandulosa HHB12029]
MRGYKVGKGMEDETALGAEMRLAKEKSGGVKKPAAKEDKVVRRVLNQVYTVGNLVDTDIMQDEEAGVASLSSNMRAACSASVCWTALRPSQISAPSWTMYAERLETVLRQIRAKELLHVKGNLTAETTRLLKTALPG